MLDESKRAAILALAEKGHGKRAIARLLQVAKGTVKAVLRAGHAEVPPLSRDEKAEPHRGDILSLYAECGGNLVRVHEELCARGAKLSYPALTAFCRRHDIGRPPRQPAGSYTFEPGQEMQHDTSPHDIWLGGTKRTVQTASLVLCFARMLFFQFFHNFDRFACKLFLTDALRFFGGAARRCMIDNTHVVVLCGTGKAMVPVPEMANFAERYGFSFAAHEVGDANRKGRVERPFHFIEHNFLAGRRFLSIEEANTQAAAWCRKVNGTYKKHLRAVPAELYAAERPLLVPLPAWVPEVYLVHTRIVDIEGYVTVHTNRYSAPWRLLGRTLEVRETKDHIDLYQGPRRIASHRKVQRRCCARVIDPAHRPPRGQGRAAASGPPPERATLLVLAPELEPYVAQLLRRSPGRGVAVLRRLLCLVRDYPREPLLAAVHEAAQYGLYDLHRLERMVLRRVAHTFFVLSDPNEEEPDDR